MSAPRTRLARALRLVALGLVLAVAAVVVPDSAVKSTEIHLVKVHRAEGVDLSPDVVWILAVGSDARPGQDMTRSRGDALQLVGMNTRTGAATAIGIPRDSWVNVPGHGFDKINAALYFGGPDLLGRAVGNLVGIRPDYVFVSRFPFFIEMVKEIGGIEVSNPRCVQRLRPQAERVRPRPDPPGWVRRDGVRADPAQPGPRRLRPLRQPAAGAARDPGQGPGPGGGPGVHRAGCPDGARTPAHGPAAEPSCSGSRRRWPRWIPRRSPAASCRAASGTSAGPAWSCRSPARPGGTATTPGRTPRSATADGRIDRPSPADEANGGGVAGHSLSEARGIHRDEVAPWVYETGERIGCGWSAGWRR